MIDTLLTHLLVSLAAISVLHPLIGCRTALQLRDGILLRILLHVVSLVVASDTQAEEGPGHAPCVLDQQQLSHITLPGTPLRLCCLCLCLPILLLWLRFCSALACLHYTQSGELQLLVVQHCKLKHLALRHMQSAAVQPGNPHGWSACDKS